MKIWFIKEFRERETFYITTNVEFFIIYYLDQLETRLVDRVTTAKINTTLLALNLVLSMLK